jgi:signal transduction histidine kinase
MLTYHQLFAFVAKERIKRSDADLGKVHVTLVTALTTSLLMWSYALIAIWYMASPVPGVVGILASVIHLLSPLLYRFTRNIFLVTFVLLGAGVIHQGTFAFYSGGFMSAILIWPGILPMLGGIMEGIRSAVVWSIISLTLALCFLLMHLQGYDFPVAISSTGYQLSQGFIVLGWIFLNTTLIILFLRHRDKTESVLKIQGERIDGLFRVLFHDLSNPIGKIHFGSRLMDKARNEAEASRGLEIIKSASDSLNDITRSVRMMYAVSTGKQKLDLRSVALDNSLREVGTLLKDQLDQKKLSLDYSPDQIAGIQVTVEPVSLTYQVLANIVSNAIKFSHEGGSIEVSARRLGDKCQIKISDHGIGMPVAIQRELFNLDKNTSRIGTQGESGTGLGMHIMQTYVELFGGEVLVESVEGKGTTFILHLPSN